MDHEAVRDSMGRPRLKQKGGRGTKKRGEVRPYPLRGKGGERKEWKKTHHTKREELARSRVGKILKRSCRRENLKEIAREYYTERNFLYGMKE